MPTSMYDTNKSLKDKSMTVLELFIIDLQDKNFQIDKDIELLNFQKKQNQNEIEKITKVIEANLVTMGNDSHQKVTL